MHKKILLLIFIFFTSSSFANEKELEQETTVFNETFSWQIMAGISLHHSPVILKDVEPDDVKNHLNISLLIDLYYKGFFIQSNHRRSDTLLLGAEMGYQLKVTDDWELDIIRKSYLAGYDPDFIIDISDREIPILNGLDERGSADGIGLRYTRYHRNSSLSIDLAAMSPFSEVNGWVGDIYYSYVQAYRNWDIYWGAGFTFYSNKVVDYYYGIDLDEVSELRSYYKPNSGFKTQLEFFAQHPISKSWTFNAGVTQSYFSKSINDSPLIDRHNTTQLMMGVIYVF